MFQKILDLFQEKKSQMEAYHLSFLFPEFFFLIWNVYIFLWRQLCFNFVFFLSKYMFEYNK